MKGASLPESLLESAQINCYISASIFVCGNTMSSTPSRTLVLQRFIPYQVVSLGKKISDSLSGIYSREFDITVAEWRVLATLAEKTRQNAKDIGELTLMDKAKVSRAVKLLEDKAYIVKQRDEKDNRASYLSLSKEGLNLYLSIVPRALSWETQLLEVLEPKEHEVFVQAMEKLGRHLDAK